MKKLIIIIILVASFFIIKIPPYVELNGLAIIEGVGMSYKDSKYTLWLKEIIPLKGENGISHKYKYYKDSGSSVQECYQKIQRKNEKKFYLKRVKFLVTNLKRSDEIIETLEIDPDIILHSRKNVLQALKKN